MLKRFISASALVMLIHGMAGTADAFTYDKRTYFTFNQSVALPGVTLPAGTYMFRLADPDTTRRVIQVSDKQGTQSYALLLTMPADRYGRREGFRDPLHGDASERAARGERLVVRR